MSQGMQKRVEIAGPEGVLEAVVEYQPDPRYLAVICHPHPLFGGTMDNKVVTTLCRAVRDNGGVALRFNFRGVGKSQGVYSDGLGEVEDLLAAIHWLEQEFPSLSLWLAGFSFGSFVAARGASSLSANDRPARHLFLVAPPVHHFDFEGITETRCPVTVVQGDDDEVVEAPRVHQWARGSELTPDLVRFPDCGHFFHGRLTELRDLAITRLPNNAV